LGYYNTSTLENKVRDIMSAVQIVKKQPGVNSSRIFLMGASEGTLLAAEQLREAAGKIRGLVLYGVLTNNMRENFKYIVTDGAFLPWIIAFDTNKTAKSQSRNLRQIPPSIVKKAQQYPLRNAGQE